MVSSNKLVLIGTFRRSNKKFTCVSKNNQGKNVTKIKELLTK